MTKIRWRQWKAINREMELFDPELIDKPQIVVANKVDLPEGRELAKLLGKKLPKAYRPLHDDLGGNHRGCAATGLCDRPQTRRSEATKRDRHVTQLEHKKPILKRARRVVVKIGSQILSSQDGIEEARLRGLVRQLAELHEGKRQVVVVSSGAVAAGMTQLGWKERPKTIPEKQALAAVGQIKLMALYERIFSKFDKSVAQVLLTADDLANRQRYINAKHTFQMLLESSIIPIVNENDTVAVEEMKFGDNDHLSALVATLLEADLLVILSDVEGVYDKDPRAHDDAQLIPLIGAGARLAPGDRRRKRQCSRAPAASPPSLAPPKRLPRRASRRSSPAACKAACWRKCSTPKNRSAH